MPKGTCATGVHDTLRDSLMVKTHYFLATNLDAEGQAKIHIELDKLTRLYLVLEQ